jgi:hypothetical protein
VSTPKQICPDCGSILDDTNDHSDPMRRYFFATLRDVHDNMPEHWRELCPSTEHLRKYALCRVGWCDVRAINCGNARVASDVAAAAKSLDRFAVVDIRDSTVTIYTARSMSRRSAPKKVFRELVNKVWDWAVVAGVTTQSVVEVDRKRANAGAA